MNVKQIAQAVYKPERTVHNWVKKTSAKMAQVHAKMAQAANDKKPADYTLDETILIIEHGLGKNAAALFKLNAEQQNQAAPINIKVDKCESRLDRLESIVDKLLQYQMNQLSSQIDHQIMLPLQAPAKTDRATLREIVNTYVKERNCYHQEAWNQLYQQIYYRMSVNVQLCAKNRNMDKLDYLEQEGLLPECISLAKSIFKI